MRRAIAMDTAGEKQRWTKQTILFGFLSNGRNDVNEDEVQSLAGPIIANINDTSNNLTIAREVINKACGLHLDHCDCSDPLQNDEAGHVMNWVLRTLGIVNSAVGKPTHGEYLEMLASEHITGPIQGNRMCNPTRNDLDAIIARTLEYARSIVADSSIAA